MSTLHHRMDCDRKSAHGLLMLISVVAISRAALMVVADVLCNVLHSLGKALNGENLKIRIKSYV